MTKEVFKLYKVSFDYKGEVYVSEKLAISETLHFWIFKKDRGNFTRESKRSSYGEPYFKTIAEGISHLLEKQKARVEGYRVAMEREMERLSRLELFIRERKE